jgi:ATP-dependent Clp protease ATP-binding subunit ClpA
VLERMTPAARAALDAAEREARRLGHDTVGSEHLLLALTSSDVVAGLDVDRDALRAALADAAEEAYGDRAALATIGIDLDEVMQRVAELYGVRVLGRNGGRPRRAASAERMLAAARREARSEGTRGVAPEHLLLGALASAASGAGVLLAHGVASSDVRREAGRDP